MSVYVDFDRSKVAAKIAAKLREAADLVEVGKMLGDLSICKETEIVDSPRSWHDTGPVQKEARITGYEWQFTGRQIP